MQHELVWERCSKDYIQVEWGSSDKGEDFDHFFRHVGSQYFLHTKDFPWPLLTARETRKKH